MYMRMLERKTFHIPTQEELLELRVKRDNDVLAALRRGRKKHAVARDFGLTMDDVTEISKADKASIAALNKARMSTRAARLRKEAREEKAANATWPPARIRNILVQEFGIALERVADAPTIAETVTRSEIMAVPMAGARIADAIAGYLEAHGQVLRD